jgi:hypothetical protein
MIEPKSELIDIYSLLFKMKSFAKFCKVFKSFQKFSKVFN